MGLLHTIKKAGISAVEAGSPVAVLYGKVSQVNPLEVSVDQRLLLPEDFLIVTERVTPYAITIGGVEYPVRAGLAAGDTVVLVRVQGGDRFLVLDKVVHV